MRHVCKICGEEREVTEFDKKMAEGPYEPWNLRRCKRCTHKQYLAMRTSPARVKANSDASRSWKQNNPELHAGYARVYRARHPEIITAQNRLNYAVRKGRIVRQPCQVCGSEDRVQAHHRSYRPEDWYNVEWLCHTCHSITHASEVQSIRNSEGENHAL